MQDTQKSPKVEIKVRCEPGEAKKFKAAAKRERKSLNVFLIVAGLERIARKQIEAKDGVNLI